MHPKIGVNGEKVVRGRKKKEEGEGSPKAAVGSPVDGSPLKKARTKGKPPRDRSDEPKPKRAKKSKSADVTNLSGYSDSDIALIQFVKDVAGTKRSMPSEKAGMQQVVTLKLEGNMLWKEAEALKVTRQSWQTMKEHYMKDLLTVKVDMTGAHL